jgi:deoxyadenosine/deoxycytidine kinase
MKRIFLEGNECNFKTTVAEKLSKRLGFEIVKGSSFEIATGTNEAMYNHFKSIIGMNNVIVDRFIYSNIVYATLYPEYTILTDHQFEELDGLLKDADSMVIYLYADTDTLKGRMSVRGDEYIKEDKLESINRMYEEIWENHTIIEPYGIDTSMFSSDDIVDFIVNQIG